jgi:hypothetical protein
MMIMKTGFVQMPLERYDELILENKRMMDMLDNIVKIEADWNNEPKLRIDLSKLAARLNEKFEQSKFAGKWIMIDLSDHVETIWGVFEEIPQEADEDQA